MLLGEMCVLSLVYTYVAVCRFCAVHCLIIMRFSWYFLITRLMFLILFLCLCSYLYVCFLFCVFCVFCIVLCIVSPFVYSCLFPIFVQVYRPLPPGGNPVAVNKYHVISNRSHHKAPVKIHTSKNTRTDRHIGDSTSPMCRSVRCH